MKVTEFKQWIRNELGQAAECSIVNVELSEGQIDQALNNAKDWFNAYVGLYKEAALTLVEGTVEYDLSAVSPAVDEVMSVWFPRQGTSLDFGVLYPGFLDIEGFPYRDNSMFGQPYPQTTIVQTLQNLKSMSRVLDVELDWEFHREDFVENVPVRVLRIMPTPRVAGGMIYQYRVDPRDLKLRMYKPRDLFLMRQYALAEAKYMLGRVRGKYTSGLPAAGGERQLDGDALLTEAREDKERLQREILDHEGPVAPLIG